MDRKKKREILTQHQLSANAAKAILMKLADQVEITHPRKAAALDRIIQRLENWQNTP